MCRSGVDSGKSLERVVQREQFESRSGAVPCAFAERDALEPVEAFLGATTPCVIHEDLPHGAAGDVEKVRAVRPIDSRLIDQLQPGIVDELGGLKRVARTLTPYQ